MSWVKQSDTLWRDYEFNRLSDGAQALWHRANSYIADQLTDGLIPPDAIKLLQTRKRYVDELVAAGRWVWQPSGGWLAAGWQEFIESRDRVLARRSESIQRANKSRAAHVRERCAPPGPGPGPGPKISSEEEEKKLSALSLSETAPANDRARPDLVGFNWYCQLLELLPTSAPAPGSWREQYAFMGSRPDAERVAIAASIRADAWCMANKHLVSPEHVRKHWQKYLGGDARPVLKPVVATPREQLEKARERLQDAAKTLRIIEGLPWFDKEKPTYPGRLAQATADVSRLRGELAKLESGFTRPAVAS